MNIAVVVLFQAVALASYTADVDGLVAVVLIKCDFTFLRQQRVF